MGWWDDLVNNVVGFGQNVGSALSSSGGGSSRPPTGGGRLSSNVFNPDPGRDFNPNPNPFGVAPGPQSMSSRQTMAPGSLGVAPNSQPFSPLIDPAERASRELAGQSGYGSGNLGKLMTGQYVPGLSQDPSQALMQDLNGLMGGGGGMGTEIATFGKTLEDYLSEAGSGEDLISNQLRGLDRQRKQSKGDAAEGKAAVGSIYGGLEDSFKGAGKEAKQQYKDTQAQVQSSTDAASNSLANALAAGNSDISQTLANLGIEDSGQQAQATRDEYGVQNANQAAQRGNYDIQNLISRGQSQQDFLQDSAGAAGFAGADAQSQIQRDLLDILGGYGDQENQLRDNAAMMARNNAVTQYNADAEAFYNQQQAQAQAAQGAAQQDQQAWQRAMDQAGLNWEQEKYYDQAQREQANLAAQAGAAGGLNNENYMDAQNYLQNYFKTDQYASDAMAKAQEALTQVPAGGGYSDAATWLREQYANRSPSVGQGALQALYLLTGGGKI